MLLGLGFLLHPDLAPPPPPPGSSHLPSRRSIPISIGMAEPGDWDKGVPAFAGFIFDDDTPLTHFMGGGSGGKGLWEAVKLAVARFLEKHPLFTPPNPPKPDTSALERFVREELEKKVAVIMKRFDRVDKSVDSLVESSVRNESHMKVFEDQFKAFEQSMVDLVSSTKETLTQEMKLLLEAHMKGYKALREKSQVQKLDDLAKDAEILVSLPGRIRTLSGRIRTLSETAVNYIAVLEFLFFIYLNNQNQPAEEVAKVEGLKPKLEELGTKLNDLPEKCKLVELQSGKFSDLGRTSADLLHSYFQSGPSSGFNLSYTADATAGAGALIFGDGGSHTINASGFGPWYLHLKTNSNRDLNAVRGSLIFPQQDFKGIVKGSFSVRVPLSSIKANAHYLHEYGGVLASLQLGADPVVNLSCVFGLKALSLGAHLGYNPVDRLWTKYDSALRYNANGLDVAVMMKDMNDSLSGSVCYKWGQSLAVGFENSFAVSTRVNKIFIGLAYSFDPMTTLKARLGLEAPFRKGDDKKGDDKKGDDREGEGLLSGKRVVGGLALLRRWGKCAAGVSVEVDLNERSAPRFGLFLKFGAQKKAATV